jgi:hypothetical protein
MLNVFCMTVAETLPGVFVLSHPVPLPSLLLLLVLLWVSSLLSQAISRVWRYGQVQPVYIYHLMYAGTFETRVFERVLVKEELFQRVSGGGRTRVGHVRGGGGEGV